ncbi:MAG: hypothetical protein KJ726_04810 [Verrucomicrobia bacterium]|nr:hypothetical protein [Verrucomicrobiota bacterium]MBU1909350.1 hypothetical protein [Verrucomicrobiota bacterium]
METIGSFERTVIITGALTTASVVTNSFTNGLSLAGYPYLAPVAMNGMNFTNILTPYIWGDRIYTWDFTGQVYRLFFYDGGGELGGGWQDADDPGHPTDYILQPIEGFWFNKISGATITWKAPAP